MAVQNSRIEPSTVDHDAHDESGHLTVETFPSAEGGELLPGRSYEARAQRKASLFAWAAALAALASAAAVLTLIRHRRFLLPVSEVEFRPPTLEEGLSRQEEQQNPYGAHQDRSLFEEQRRYHETADSDTTSSSMKYFDAVENALPTAQSGVLPSDGDLGVDSLQGDLKTVSFSEFSSMSKGLLFTIMPKFPPVSAGALEELKVPPFVRFTDYIMRLMARKAGYGTDISEAATPAARGEAVRGEFSYFLRAVEASEGKEATDSFVDAALLVENGGLGQSGREDVTLTLWVTCAYLKNRELLLAERVRLKENRLRGALESSEKLSLPEDVGGDTTGDTLPSLGKDASVLSHITSKDLMSMSREVKELMWTTIGAHVSLEKHYSKVAAMVGEVNASAGRPVLFAAEMSILESMKDVARSLRDPQKLGFLGAARLAAKMPSVMHSLKHAEKKASQPWFVTDLMRTARWMAEQSEQLERDVRISLFGLVRERRMLGVSPKSVARTAHRIRIAAEQHNVPKWAVAAICLFPN